MIRANATPNLAGPPVKVTTRLVIEVVRVTGVTPKRLR